MMPALDLYDESRHNVKRARKRLLVISCSTLLLLVVVACLAVGIHQSNKHQKNGTSSGNIKFIQTTCSKTDFPDECVSSLSASPSAHKATTPAEMAAAAVEVAESSAEEFLSLVQALATSETDVSVKAALLDCVDNVDSAVEQLNSSLAMIGQGAKALLHGQGSVQDLLDDILTSLSAALTFHTTCLDGFEGIVGASSARIAPTGQRLQRLLSDMLSLYSASTPVLPPPLGRRLLETATPHWTTAAQRRLLASPPPECNVVVAKDGSGKYKRIQAAVDAAPLKRDKPYVICVKGGVYSESVSIPKKATNIVLLGEGARSTILTGSKNVQQPGVTTFSSSTLIVSGAGFLARGLSICNTAGPDKHQAVALRVSADKVVIHNCSIEAFQDTLYAHSLRSYYRDTTILGTVDFVFGNAAAVLDNCKLLARVGNAGQQVTFTAQGRTDKNQNTGLVFAGCTLDATPELKKEIGQHPSYLGRPWKLYSRTVLMQSYLSGIIQPRGWLEWDGNFALKTLFYGEFRNTGPGSYNSKRVPWSTNMTDKKLASKFTPKSFIGGDSWIPKSATPYTPGLRT